MEKITMESLLKAEEEKLRNELLADSEVDKDRKLSVRRINEVYSKTLLKYNAANSGDALRQAMADSLTGVACEELDLLLASSAKKELSERSLRTGGIIGLLLAVIFSLLAALLMQRSFPFACASVACAVVSAFFGGKAWYGERTVSVRSAVDADEVMRVLRRTAVTMDRKMEDLDSQIRQTGSPSPVSTSDAVTDIALLGELLEALYSENGDYALRQLKKLVPWLQRCGIEMLNYSEDHAELFEVLPSRKASRTLRPALLSDGKLLLTGRATETTK
ncbi:MAG: hypothetical protein K6C08_03685 [Oscillospiraceae bacterium]|nr:hypothetical protein [Oscillospiraceae bacterium]